MKRTHLLAIASACLAFATSSCFDDKYDLSDIDKTVQVNVNQLVIPVNIDDIMLSSVIDETDNLKIIDGHYAYVTQGDFNSDPIDFKDITIHNELDDNVPFTIHRPTDMPLNARANGLNLPEIIFKVGDYTSKKYSFNFNNISKNIVDLIHVNTNTITLSLKLDLSSLSNIANQVELKDLTVYMPKNLITDIRTEDGTYDAETGKFTINKSVNLKESKTLEIDIDIVGFDLEKFNFKSKLQARSSEDESEDNSMELSGDLEVTGGDFIIYPIDDIDPNDIESEYDLSIEYAMEDDIHVNSVSADIEYAIDNVDMPQVGLENIPGFLNQLGTNLILADPQLYLHTTNPLYEYGLYAQTGIEIIANRVGQGGTGIETKTFSIDKPFQIGGKDDKGKANLNYVLSPVQPNSVDQDYANSKFVQFSTLGEVLSGDGLPKTLKVNLVDPKIPIQRVTDFKLGTHYAPVQGTWKFVAPLALKTGSFIMYTDVVDGWSSEDLDKVTITQMEVTVNVSTDIPVGVEFSGRPIGKDGKPIAGVSITGAAVDPMAKDQPVTIVVKMPAEGIKGLDGIQFEAVASAQDGPTLSPNMNIKVSNIRPCVSGYYQTEL